MIVLYILLAIFIFGFLIFIHELGHFLVARACGVKILEFAIGMGPRILSHRSKKSGTVYALRLLPIGGFVSMLGESGMELAQGNEKGEVVTSDPENPLLNDVKTPEEAAEITAEDEKHAYCNQSAWTGDEHSSGVPFDVHHGWRDGAAGLPRKYRHCGLSGGQHQPKQRSAGWRRDSENRQHAGSHPLSAELRDYLAGIQGGERDRAPER